MNSKILLSLALALPLVACAGESATPDDDGAPAEVDATGIPNDTDTSADEVVSNACSADKLTCLTYGQLQDGGVAGFTIDANTGFGHGNKIRVCVRKRAPERGEVFCKTFGMNAGSAATPMVFQRRILFTTQHFPNADDGNGLYNVSVADDANRTKPLVLKTFQYVD